MLKITIKLLSAIHTTDPAHNAIIGIESVTTDTFTVNIGVSTTGKFPDNNGRVFTVKSVPSSKQFSVHVGENRFEHTYVNGGKTRQNIVRPFDGQVVYFDELYNTVGKITITNAGSGYNSQQLQLVLHLNLGVLLLLLFLQLRMDL